MDTGSCEQGPAELGMAFEWNFTREDIETIDSSFEILPYTGKGRTSYNPEFHEQKLLYLQAHGVNTESLVKRGPIETTFRMFVQIPRLRKVLDEGGNLGIAIEAVKEILKKRITHAKFKQDLGNGKCYEDYDPSCNPTSLVSEKEFMMCWDLIRTSLPRKNPSEMV